MDFGLNSDDVAFWLAQSLRFSVRIESNVLEGPTEDCRRLSTTRPVVADRASVLTGDCVDVLSCRR